MKKVRIYDREHYSPTPRYDKLDHRRKRVIKIFSNHKFNRILDIGCGDGKYSALLGKVCNATEVYGIDISEKGVKLARNNGIKAFQLDIDEDDLPFKDNYFDAIFCGDLIEHLYDPDHLLDECYRVLKEGGLFVITTPNLASWINRIALLFGFQPYATNVSLRYSIGHLYEPLKGSRIGEADHKKVFTYRSIIRLLCIHKFNILNTIGERTNIPSNLKTSILVNGLDRVFSLFPSLAHSMIIVCVKSAR